MGAVKLKCNQLLEKGWQDTDQAFEKLSHVITFKSRGDTIEALAHWTAATRYRAKARKALTAAVNLLVDDALIEPSRAESRLIESAKLLNRVHQVGLGMLMSALEACLKGNR